MSVIAMADAWLSFRPRGDRGQRQAAVWALREVNLDIAAGECVAVMGPNGCGKSTLLRVAAGIYQPDRGQVIRPANTAGVLDLTMGQNRELSGYQALELFAALDGKTASQWRSIRPTVIESTKLPAAGLERALSTYSLGMLLRLQLALALCEGRDALVLDEVLAAADSSYRHAAVEQVRQLIDNGVAVLLASHDTSLIRDLAQRVVVIERGEIIYDGTVTAGIQCYERTNGTT
jgi:ABC-type polysaccharide/polyol phosphate transport system ATPase subunit